MTSNSSKMSTNEATGPTFTSEESEGKGRTNPIKNHITDFRKEDHSRGEAMVEVIQYVKMTQDIDLNNMTTDEDILPEFREELEIKIKDIFIWALGEAAVTERTKTV